MSDDEKPDCNAALKASIERWKAVAGAVQKIASYFSGEALAAYQRETVNHLTKFDYEMRVFEKNPALFDYGAEGAPRIGITDWKASPDALDLLLAQDVLTRQGKKTLSEMLQGFSAPLEKDIFDAAGRKLANLRVDLEEANASPNQTIRFKPSRKDDEVVETAVSLQDKITRLEQDIPDRIKVEVEKNIASFIAERKQSGKRVNEEIGYPPSEVSHTLFGSKTATAATVALATGAIAAAVGGKSEADEDGHENKRPRSMFNKALIGLGVVGGLVLLDRAMFQQKAGKAIASFVGRLWSGRNSNGPATDLGR